ncbi:MAG TPA: NAD(P)/FAD-dependent oxidoreductase [Opitutaceae bacterium]|jgi:kynurenine 3-monooxygenase
MHAFTVIGCGMAGPALALALARNGTRVVLLDREPRKAAPDSGRAVNITLCNRGIEALKKIGLGSEAINRSQPLYGRMIHDRNGSRNFEAYGPNAEALYSIRRRELRELLVETAAAHPGVELISEANCSAIDLEARLLTVEFEPPARPRVLSFQHLAAADGVNSTVRNCLEKAGYIRTECRNVNLGYRELTIKAEQVTRLALERGSLHFWPRGESVLIGFPNLDGSITLSLHMPLSGSPSFDDIATEGALRDFFAREFPDLAEILPMILTSPPQRQPGRVKCVRCPSWFVGDRVVLVGDAAHGIIPYYGQGANAGFEDAAVLADLLAENPKDCGRAFSLFESKRKADLDFMSDLCFQHFDLLRSALGTRERQLLSRVEHMISALTPHRSLYYHISFTELSYRESHRASQFFHRLAQSALEHLGRTLSEAESDVRDAVSLALAESFKLENGVDRPVEPISAGRTAP